MGKEIVLTGIKPTEQFHLGNYVGAIRPSLAFSQNAEKSYLFIADYHALTTVHKGQDLKRLTYEAAATWLACGLDPKNTIIYKQSDIPEIFELNWILSCFTTKGLMNRSHAYKAKVAEAESAGKKDVDGAISMALFSYPVLMSADILMFSTTMVPVGEDQIQHVEYARDIAQKFNRAYGDILTVPEYSIATKTMVGLDGRKMSKSYGNHIPLFSEPKKLRKLIMKIKTDSLPPEAPKNPKDSLLMEIYKEFASKDEVKALGEIYKKGVGWGEVKQTLYEKIEEHFSEMKVQYDELMAHPEKIDAILADGAEQAREQALPLMHRVREAVGVK